MADFVVRSLSTETWDDFAALVAAHNGVWGGCWCMGFHAKGPGWGVSAELNRAEKRVLVAESCAHAALVFDGELCVGWSQFGPPQHLPRIKHCKAYEAGFTALPDWRITCFFVARTHRGQGVAATALAGALDLIGGLGGGVVESYPEDTDGRKVSGSFLHNGTLAMFDAAGFVRDRRIGKDRWVVRRGV
jgi:GNAT superfamily N-acetyltransferase